MLQQMAAASVKERFAHYQQIAAASEPTAPATETTKPNA
jgi:hypothetical protein